MHTVLPSIHIKNNKNPYGLIDQNDSDKFMPSRAITSIIIKNCIYYFSNGGHWLLVSQLRREEQTREECSLFLLSIKVKYLSLERYIYKRKRFGA